MTGDKTRCAVCDEVTEDRVDGISCHSECYISKTTRFALVDGVLERTEEWPEDANWLEESIAKWQFMRACIVAGMEVYIDGGEDTCGLCWNSNRLFWDGCDECIVGKTTGKTVCRGTPYEQWVELMNQDLPMTVEVADAEIEFLESLR